MVAGPFDQAVDRSRHECVIQIEFGLDQIAFRRIQRSPRGEVFCNCVVDVFLADGVFGEQRLDSLQILLGLDEPRLGLGDPAFGAHIGCLEGHGIDLIEAVTLLDVAPLGKETLLDDTGDLWPYLNDTRGLGLSDEFRLVGDGLKRGLNHLHLGHRRCRRGTGLSFTSGQCERADEKNDA